MESERENLASDTPKSSIEEGAVEVLSKDSKDEVKASHQGDGAFTESPSDNLPDLVTEAKKSADSPKENVEKISSIGRQSESSTLNGENKTKSSESEGISPVEDLKASKDDVSDLKRQLQCAREDNDKLLSQLDASKEKVADLELKQETLSQNNNELEKGKSELKLQLKSAEELASRLEDNLKVAEEKLKATGEEVSSLQQQLADLMLKEAKSAEHLKDVEEGAQELQFQLQSKLDHLQGSLPQLEEKVTQLENLLSASELDGVAARKKASELEVELKGLHENHGELSEKVKMFQDKCSQHETTALTSSGRIMNLEELITDFKNNADVTNSKVATLEAALLDSQNRAADLERQLKLAKESSLMLEDRSVARIAELEESFKEYASTNKELQEMLADRQKEIDSSIDKMNELKLSVKALESELRNASEREVLVNEERTSVGEELAKLGALKAKLESEKHELEVSMQQHKSLAEKGKTDLDDAFALEKDLRCTIATLEATISELQGLLIESEEEKKATTDKLESLTKSFAELNNQLLEERQQLQQEIATAMCETEDLRHKVAISEEKLHVALSAEELSAKQVQEGFLKVSTLTGQLEGLEVQLKKAHDMCANVETLEQEKGVLAHEFATAQEKMRAMFEAAELSARDLEAASSRELALKAEGEELKVQLEKAMDACSQVARLEQTLQNSVSKEEHEIQMDKLLTASRLAESKLADLQEQLQKSKLEIKDALISNIGPETHVRDLDSNVAKATELFERQPSDSDFSSVREMDLDLQNPGKARMRKKKGVTWESDLPLKPSATHKPSSYLLNSYVAMMVIALASLMTGFWLASNVQF